MIESFHDAIARAEHRTVTRRDSGCGRRRPLSARGDRASRELMQASDWIAEALVAQGVDTVYEVVGGMIANFIDALHRDGRVRIVSCHHEQAAGFSAEGHARMTGVPGVAMATSGPGRDQPADGARQLPLRLGAGRLHHRPGQPLRAEGRAADPPARLSGDRYRGDGRADRQGGLARRTAEELPEPARGGVRARARGPPRAGARRHPDGPAARRGRRAAARRRPSRSRRTSAQDVAAAIERMLDDLGGASRPLILAGGGLRAGAAVREFRELVERARRARRELADGRRRAALRASAARRHDRHLRQPLGEHRAVALRPAARARQPPRHPPDRRRHRGFRGGRPIHHVDCDPGELNNRVIGCHALSRSSEPFARGARERGRGRPPAALDAWRGRDRELARTLAGHRRAAGVAGDQPERADAPARALPQRRRPTWPMSASIRCGRRSRSS